jgi:hypothetical protein
MNIPLIIAAVYLVLAGPGGYQGAPSGAVVNRIVLDDPAAWSDTTETGQTLVPDDGRNIWQSPPLVPSNVETWKLKVAMSRVASKSGAAGKSVLDDANALAVAVGGAVSLAWNEAATVDRTSVTIAAMAPRLGLSDADIDALFIVAQGVKM